jgi:hypothetical protein
MPFSLPTSPPGAIAKTADWRAIPAPMVTHIPHVVGKMAAFQDGRLYRAPLGHWIFPNLQGLPLAVFRGLRRNRYIPTGYRSHRKQRHKAQPKTSNQQTPARDCAICRAPSVCLDIANDSSFGTLGVQRNRIGDCGGGTVPAFVLHMAKLLEGLMK